MRGLSDVHNAAVFVCPSGSAGALGTDKSVINAKNEVFELSVVEEVAVSFVELVAIVFVAHNDFAVLDFERVGKIFSYWVFGDFWCPASEILAVKDGFEILLG